MIYLNKSLILEIQNEIRLLYNNVLEPTLRHFGAIYKGSKLVWKTVYAGIKSCFGSGTWIGNKLWLDNDTWRNN